MSSQFKSTEYVLRVLRDADVEVSHMNEDEGCIWLAIPVDNPVEDDDSVMKSDRKFTVTKPMHWQQEDTLHIPEFAHGYLLCYSLYHASDVRESGENDAWEQVMDVPLFAGEHCDYKTYDLNFWVDDEDDGRMYCTAYEVWHDEEGMAHTKTDEWRRLW